MIRRRPVLLAALAASAVAAGVAVAATAAGDRTSTPRAAPTPAASSAAGDSPVRVVVPGRPGESATVSDSGTVRGPAASTYNTLDVAFVQMMIAHHTQALRMAAMAPRRAADPRVKALAERIRVAQGPEITVLRAWLRERRLDAGAAQHDHAAMPGMQSDEAMRALAGARGADFDRRFVAMMTDHHAGAVQMAGDLLDGGDDGRLLELAGEMAVEQRAEIARMRQFGLR